MKGYSVIFFVVFLLFSQEAFTQTTGCHVASTNEVYLDVKRVGILGSLLEAVLGTSKVYDENGAKTSIETACISQSKLVFVNNVPSQPCNVCPDGVRLGPLSSITGAILGCNNNNVLSGFIATQKIVQCNFDDYSWALGAAAGLFGVFVIRRRNKL